MISFASIYQLLNLCLQSLNQEKVCQDCIASLEFLLKPPQAFEKSYFYHPAFNSYTLRSAPLLKEIRKRIQTISYLIFFLEEILIRIREKPSITLSSAVLTLVIKLRRTKLFPTVSSLSQTSFRLAKRDTNTLKKSLRPQVIKIAKILAFESAYATPCLKCDCQELLVREMDGFSFGTKALVSATYVPFMHNTPFALSVQIKTNANITSTLTLMFS